MKALKHQFRWTDLRHRIEADRRRSRDFYRQRDEQAKKQEDIKENAAETANAFGAATTVAAPAPPERIVEFEATLTEYDTAVVQALFENERLQDLIQAQIQVLLDQAYTLPDGRRVFRTEDGTAVIDEFGEELSPDIVHPDEIPDAAPTWESFQTLKDQSAALAQERQDILEYQSKLDDAREQIAEGDISLEDLEALEADLADSMPPAVAVHAQNVTVATPEPATAPAEIAQDVVAPNPDLIAGFAGPT